ncbi:hypothetical protein [Companilactobacillus furfuricola]|uniref:hypothetical protein n=1 Tax=Companilactobacillus furfuricola TaxID=1462575 RepID=UPI001FE45255|nr:hypothetical protein [Companilactobacillus furfuricola]
MEIFSSFFQWVLLVLIAFALVPYLTAWVTSKIGHFSKEMLVNNLGPNSQLVIGGLGVIIHEFGHAFFALLFRHHVDRVQLLNIHYANTGTLGSVEHSWNQRSLYQRLGNFFIGIAPYYMCSIVLLVLQKFLLNSNIDFSIFENADKIDFNLLNLGFMAVLDNLLSMYSHASWLFIILSIIVFTLIASTGYDLSVEDFHTVNQGVIPWVIVLIGITIICLIFQQQSFLTMAVGVMIIFSIAFMIQAIVYICFSLIVIRILSLL